MKKAFLFLMILMAFYFFSDKTTFFEGSNSTQSLFTREAGLQQNSKANLFHWGQQPIKIQTQLEALAECDRFIKEHESEFPIRSYHQLKGQVLENPLGMRVKYEVSQNEIPIVGMEIELQINSLGKVTVSSNSYYPIEKVESNSDAWGSDSVVIYVEPGKNQGEIAYNVSVSDPNKKAPVLAHAVFSAMSGQLLARHVARSEF